MFVQNYFTLVLSTSQHIMLNIFRNTRIFYRIIYFANTKKQKAYWQSNRLYTPYCVRWLFMNKYFENISTLEELRKQYKKFLKEV